MPASRWQGAGSHACPPSIHARPAVGSRVRDHGPPPGRADAEVRPYVLTAIGPADSHGHGSPAYNGRDRNGLRQRARITYTPPPRRCAMIAGTPCRPRFDLIRNGVPISQPGTFNPNPAHPGVAGELRTPAKRAWCSSSPTRNPLTRNPRVTQANSAAWRRPTQNSREAGEFILSDY